MIVMSARSAMVVLTVSLLGACGKAGAGASCGFATVAGSTLLLSEFTRPGQTLSAPPRTLPERLVARVVAGPAYPAEVGRSANALVVGIEGALPAKVTPGFGVLILDLSGSARGVMLYESRPIRDAPQLGTVTVGQKTIPLLGIQLDPARIEDPRCPFFPDSILR
jgi:hypothetical protein